MNVPYAASSASVRCFQKTLAALLLPIAILLPAVPAQSYELVPASSATQDKLQDIISQGNFLAPITSFLAQHFAHPVHEGLTAKAFDCASDLTILDCGSNPDRYLRSAVLAGLHWNDNPQFRFKAGKAQAFGCTTEWLTTRVLDLDNDPACWLVLFRDAGRRAASGQHLDSHGPNGPYALIYRVHYGDLQFIHAMGSWDGELPDDTFHHLMSWAELTYRVASGEEPGLDAPIISITPALADVFAPNGFSPRTMWMPGRLKKSADNDAYLRDMALGSLMHTIEDSFSTAHTDRRGTAPDKSCEGLGLAFPPSAVHQYYSYNSQDSSKHGDRDAAEYAEKQLGDEHAATSVMLGAEVRKMLEAKQPWDKARPLFECMFAHASDAIPAGPGSDFQ